ncbi:MAG: TIGR00730 family Rossman fold protein [Burkholderiaceae bacterium]
MTSSKKAPQLRSIADSHRSTTQKARGSWHILGIISEFVEATEKLASVRPAVSIFGSARLQPGSPWYEWTVELSRALSDAGFAVISGGGPGIMEAANKGAQDGASPSIGLNIKLPMEEGHNEFQDISVDFRHFFARKVAFAKYASAFVAVPGGFGTLDELAEVLTLIQTGMGRRIPVILAGRDFWQPLVDWMRNQQLGEGLISEDDLDLFLVTDDQQAVIDAIFDFYQTRSFEPTDQDDESLLSL